MAVQSKLIVILSAGFIGLLCGPKNEHGAIFFCHPCCIDYRINSTVCVFYRLLKIVSFHFYIYLVYIVISR